MDENLAGYLLKALDDDTQRNVQASLKESPELRSRLERLERALAPLAADRETAEPPPGLILSTLARIAEYQCRKLPDAPPPPRSQTVPAGRSWLRRPDVLVAALLLITLGGIGSSALVHLWRVHGRTACQENLSRVWTGLQVYCSQHNGDFPRIEEKGPHSAAGIFVPILSDSGVLSPEVSVTCPAQGSLPPKRRSVHEMEKMYEENPTAFRQEARRLAGGYAYTLGYFDAADGYRGLRCDSGDHLPIIADRLESLRELNSANHGGGGQNVLYLGGHVEWRTNRHAGIAGDDIFVNWDNQILAGKAREDTVLGPGDASPIPRE